MKYLLWAVLIYLAWRWFSATQARKNRQGGEDARDTGATTATSATPAMNSERMVECAECGLHLPLSEALPGPGERFFCGEAHRDKQRVS